MSREKKELLRRFVNNRCTPEELSLVKRLLQDERNLPLLRELMDEEQANFAGPYKPRVPAKSRRLVLPWRRMAAAVLILLACGAGLYYAGTWWNLKRNKLVWEQIETRAGERKTIRLPDGSLVKLNSLSMLEYPRSFKGEKRAVRLSGEGFFQVARDPDHPFEVWAEEVRVRVLGTSFNIRDYPGDRQLELGVHSGEVAVGKQRDTTFTHYLSAGKGIRYDRKLGMMTLQRIDTLESGAWRTGGLFYRSRPLNEVIRGLERRFDVRIRLEAAGLAHEKVTLSLEHGRLDKALSVISFTLDLEVRKEGDEFVLF